MTGKNALDTEIFNLGNNYLGKTVSTFQPKKYIKYMIQNIGSSFENLDGV